MDTGNLFVFGLNHNTASLYIREKAALTRDELPKALCFLKEFIGDAVVLSTCNRTELYFISSDIGYTQEIIMDFLAERIGTTKNELSGLIYLYQHNDAIEHLFRVVSGLDSLIIGESQILGQIREAYSVSVANKVASGTVSKIFHQALRVGKRARKETGIGEHSVSISSSAVAMARNELGDLSDKKIMIIGSGEAGKLVAMSFRDYGVGELLILNRTFERAVELADLVNGKAYKLETMKKYVGYVDVIVTSTDSKDILINENIFTDSDVSINNKPLVIIDIAVPRDVDPSVKRVPNVVLFDMDDIQRVANNNVEHRKSEIWKVEDIIKEEIFRFETWWESLKVTPSITLFRDRIETIRSQELSKLFKVMHHLSENDRSAVEMFSKALSNKFMHNPISAIKENPGYSILIKQLFNLDEVKHDNSKG